MSSKLLRLYIESLMVDIDDGAAVTDASEVDESTGAGAAIGAAGPGWVEPTGFALRSSKRRGKKRKTTLSR